MQFSTIRALFWLIFIFGQFQYGVQANDDLNQLSDDQISILNEIGSSFENQVISYPCLRYHTHICGQLGDSDDFSSVSLTVTDVKKLVDEYILDKKISTLTEIELKARNYINSCFDQINFEKLHENLKELDIFDYDESWTFGKNWNEETFDWITMAAKFQSFGNPIIIEVTSGTYEGQNVLLIRPKYLTEFNEIEFELDFNIFGADMKESNQIVRNNLTAIRDNNQNINTAKQIFSLDSLKEAFPNFHWSQYFDVLFNGRNLADETMIVVTNKSQIIKLIELINVMDEKDVANTFLYELLFQTKSNDIPLMQCYDLFQKNFKDVLALIIVENFINKNDANSQSELYKQFLLSLDEKASIRLLRRGAVAQTRDGLKAFKNIAKNQDTFQFVFSEYINKEYKNLKIDYRNYIQNQINLGCYQMKTHQFSNFYNNFKTNLNENPYVDFFKINFQTFYRLHNKPMSFYFAILGEPFWENVIRVGIDTKLLENCHFESYQSTKNYKMPIENLIKFGASRMAYDDLRQWQRKNFNLSRKEDEILTNHNYNGRKIFFHIYMQKRCKNFINYDYAFIGHSRDFTKEYKCSTGNRMSYIQKCTPWEGSE